MNPLISETEAVLCPHCGSEKVSLKHTFMAHLQALLEELLILEYKGLFEPIAQEQEQCCIHCSGKWNDRDPLTVAAGRS